MAYPNYPYPGYSPYYPQPVPDQLAQLRQQQMQQAMMQGPQVPMPPQSVPTPAVPQSNGIIWVDNEQEADRYPISPGSAIALWDRGSPEDKPVIYLRQTDSTGRPITKVYDLVERTGNQIVPQQIPQIDMSNVVMWDKLDAYLDAYFAERLKRPSKATQKKEETDNG